MGTGWGAMETERSQATARFSDQRKPGRERITAIALAATFHVGVLWAVIHGFGGVPALTAIVKDPFTTQTFDVPLEQPKPSPTPTAPEPAGASAAEGRKAKAAQVVAKARVPAPVRNAPPVASTGNDAASGASDKGTGTGGGGTGAGTGSGASGNGSGGGLARKAEKIAGDIRSTRDYPAKSRDERIGKRVVILLDVGTDGRVTGCRVWRASGVPEADAITCRLATERFRFKPATDYDGAPIASTYGWEQRWFAP